VIQAAILLIRAGQNFLITAQAASKQPGRYAKLPLKFL
jgi:hypothetical protein